ncbi:MAG: Uma2 family endonuclease [Chloroflexi bacterium]|nr:Uma2 family endonuclease [Chloroflexota bacterium]
MVTVKPEPTDTAETQELPEPNWSLVGELRLNLTALGVDHLADDFGERLCQLSGDNPGWQFEYSARGELIVMAPPGSESSLDETEVTVAVAVWRRSGGGMSYGPTIGFRLPSRAVRIPDAAWITQERYDNLTPSERRGTINGAPDFVVEVRSRSDRLPPFLAKMQEWMDGGARLGWGIDPRNSHVYIYRTGQTGPELLEDPETLSGEDILPQFTFEVRRLIFDRHTEESES